MSADIPVPDKPRKIAIIGYTESKKAAPWDDPEWTFWGMNDLHSWIKDTRWDGWFDVHDRKTQEENEEHLSWLKQRHGFPVWMTEPSDEFPSAVPLPLVEMRRRFGRGYFTNTVSYMVAMAILQLEWAAGDGAEIGVYGVDMAAGSEYAAQRPSCEYYIGVAEGMGIKVTIPPTSDLLTTAALYGTPESDALRAKLTERMGELKGRMAEVENEKARAFKHVTDMEAMRNQLIGAMENTEYLLATRLPPAHDPETPRAANDVRSGAPPT